MRCGITIALILVCRMVDAQPLPGTAPLNDRGDLLQTMLAGIHRFLDRETVEAQAARASLWRRDYSSTGAYERSIAPNRERLKKIIGVVDARVPFDGLELLATTSHPAGIATGAGSRILGVRWPAIDGVHGEGLLLEPAGPPRANVIALPDADWTPEMIAGLAPGAPPFALLLVENGYRVLIPTLIDRRDTWSGDPSLKLTNQSHREILHRMAYELGRHIIGYEVQKVLAGVDWMERTSPGVRIAVAGYGEGGLIALYSAAVDPRISGALVSGYFDSREELWKEPLYRNIWSLLREFGDAELAGLIAPRPLIVEAARAPEVATPREYRTQNAAPGRLTTPDPARVRLEFERAREIYNLLRQKENIRFEVSGDGRGDPLREPALQAFHRAIHTPGTWTAAGTPPERTKAVDSDARQLRQFQELVDVNLKLADASRVSRAKFWAGAKTTSVADWERTTVPYRKYYWEELIGRFPDPTEPLRPRTRKMDGGDGYDAYEVVLPVWRDVFAYGALLIPKGMQPGERRPVVVCQHGVNDRIEGMLDPQQKNIYNHFATRLAQQGFIVYLPQNPYSGEPKFAFRVLQRKANPLKRSIFSIIAGQHERLLDWLQTLPFVDPRRIALYGLSYGGETAVRIAPILQRYALSICSGNFNEWVRKTTDFHNAATFLYMGGYDHYDFDLANTFDDADMAALIAPRPFMVERGHRDPVGEDEWVAFEYAKVRRLYAALGIPERTAIEWFDGVHEIHLNSTLDFLKRFLRQ